MKRGGSRGSLWELASFPIALIAVILGFGELLALHMDRTTAFYLSLIAVCVALSVVERFTKLKWPLPAASGSTRGHRLWGAGVFAIGWLLIFGFADNNVFSLENILVSIGVGVAAAAYSEWELRHAEGGRS